MLRHIVAVGLGLILAAPAWASWADDLFEQHSRDFGSVPRGSVVSHPFRIVNNTNSTVHISAIRVSCGCVTARALKDTLAPGQETAIVAQMDTGRFQLSRLVNIYVTFDQPSWAEVRLWVRADSRDDVTLNPDSLEFGRIQRGDSPHKSTQISLLGSSAYRIVGVASDSNYVQPECKLLSAGEYEVRYELTAKLRSDVPPGRWYTDLWLSTNNPAMPKVRVPLTVEVASALSVSPSTVLMGDVKTGSETVRKVIVRSSQPFQIVGIDGTDQQIQVHNDTSEQRAVHVLTVTLRPTEAGSFSRTLQIRTNLEEESTISFTTRAFVSR